MSDLHQVGARRATFDIGIQIVARILNLALGVVVTLVLVRGLGRGGFGAWSSIFAVSQIASSFGELGLNEVAVNRAAADPEHEPSWLGALLSLRLLISLPITLLSAVAVVLVAPNHASKVAGVLLSLVLLLGTPMALGAVFQLRVRNHVSMALLTLNSVVWGAGVIAVASLSGGIVAFSVAFLASSVLIAVLTAGIALRMAAVKLSGSREHWRDLLRVGIGLGVAGVLVTAYVRLDQVLVLEYAGAQQAGLYGAAYRLLDQVQFIPISVMTTLFPMIAAAYSRREDRARRLLQTAAEYLAMASFPILAFTIVASAPVVDFLFGQQFSGAAPAVPILAGAFVSISFGYLVGNMVIVLELQRRFATFAALGLVINAALNVLLIPRYGFVASAWITLLTEVTVMTLSMRAVLRALRMRPQVARLLRTLAAAGGMGVLTWLARLAGVPLAGLVAIAALTYVPCLFLLRALSVSEIVAVLKKDPVGISG
ncbi:MAG TPA: flippase [Solirubrobacteraceae bacterium]|nr:flippase [Solirubrobacteraceae bacterium]